MYNMFVQLIPLHICLAAGLLLATGYTLRLAFKNPDCQWNKKKDPNEAYRDKQYKVRSSSWRCVTGPGKEVTYVSSPIQLVILLVSLWIKNFPSNKASIVAVACIISSRLYLVLITFGSCWVIFKLVPRFIILFVVVQLLD